MRSTCPSFACHPHVTKVIAAFVAAVLGWMALCTCPGTICAQQPQPYECRVSERTAQGVTLDCAPGYATAHDRVSVSGELLTGDWDHLGPEVLWLPDIKNGWVVFDAAADGSANLVIRFSQRPDGACVAELYDDQTRDGRISYQIISAASIRVDEPGPVVRVVAPAGWWHRQEVVNFNLDIVVDGPVRAFMAVLGGKSGVSGPDGIPDADVHVRDVDGDGNPDYEWRQVYYPFPESAAYVRTEVIVNTEDDEPPISGAVLWPYLGDARSDWNQYAKLAYRQSDPPINVTWGTSGVTHVAEFLASRTEPGNYFIYSLRRIAEGKLSPVDWEAPFAFYDLSGESQVLPNLMIRVVHFDPRDPVFMNGRNALPLDDVVYCWRYPSERQEQLPTWNYKVSLAGTHAYSSVVNVGDLSMVMPPYAELPSWVTERAWDFATFVANEGVIESNSEGIRPWGAVLEYLSPEGYEYMLGSRDELSLDRFRAIAKGYRGEVVPVLNSRPALYISSVDGKVHIVGAAFGVWNVDDYARIQYANLDGDLYLDQWQYLAGEDVVRQLNLAAGYFIYAGDGRVLLRQVDMLPAQFEAPPPRNHKEWLTLRQQVDSHRRGDAPEDLESMMMQFEGPLCRVEGAALSDLRLTEDGFRFVLTLHPGFRVPADESKLGLGNLSVGSCLVTYDGRFHVQSLTPPRITLPAGEISCDPPAPQQMAWTTIKAVLQNSGLQDAQSLPVRLYAAPDGGGPLLLAEKQVSVPGEGTHTLVYKWVPREPGRWTIWVEPDLTDAVPAGVKLGSLARLEVEVQAASLTRMLQLSAPYDGVRLTWPVALLLGSIALTAVSTVWMILKRDTEVAVVEPTERPLR